MSIKIKNWNKYQHFKDRTPPWIKLYRDILDDPDWHELSGDSAKTLVSLWLIASEDESRTGSLPDTRKLAFRLRTTEIKLNQELNKLSCFLVRDDIKPISNRYHDDAPEERRGEENREENNAPANAVVFNFKRELEKLGVDAVTVSDWLTVRKAKKARNTQTAFAGFVREVKKSGFDIAHVVRMCCEKNWSGFDAEWVKGQKPAQPTAEPFDEEAYKAKREAQAAAAREQMRREWAELQP